jgi:hypothetical protein
MMEVIPRNWTFQVEKENSLDSQARGGSTRPANTVNTGQGL